MHYYYDPSNPSDPWQPYPNVPPSDDPDDFDYDRATHHAIIHALSYLGVFIATIVLIGLATLLFSSCTTTRTVTVEHTVHDTIHVNHLQRDSVFLGSVFRDSIVEKQRGDTIFIDRWHAHITTEYRDRFHHDSIYIALTDSVPVPYPVEKPVPAPLTPWQRFRLWLANAFLIALGLYALVLIIKKKH